MEFSVYFQYPDISRHFPTIPDTFPDNSRHFPTVGSRREMSVLLVGGDLTGDGTIIHNVSVLEFSSKDF